MSRFEKFEGTCVAWYILLYPLVLVIMFVLMLLFGIETSVENIDVALYLSFFIDFVLLIFVGSFLFILDEYKTVGDKSYIERGN